MRITTKITWDMNTGEVLHHAFHHYDGPVALCGSHPDPMQTQAAQANLVISKQAADTAAAQNARENDQYAQVKPYLTNRLNNGLDFMPLLTDSQGGLTARSFAPAYADLNKRFAVDGLPSGSKDAAIRALDAQRAQAFDAQLLNGLQMNDAAKQDAAAAFAGQQGMALNAAIGNQNSALSGNKGVLDAQSLTRTSGLGGILGGALQGVGSAAIKAIPF